MVVLRFRFAAVMLVAFMLLAGCGGGDGDTAADRERRAAVDNAPLPLGEIDLSTQTNREEFLKAHCERRPTKHELEGRTIMECVRFDHPVLEASGLKQLYWEDDESYMITPHSEDDDWYECSPSAAGSVVGRDAIDGWWYASFVDGDADPEARAEVVEAMAGLPDIFCFSG